MYVSIINGETSNHMIHEKEAAKCEGIFGMANSAVILNTMKTTANQFGRIAHRYGY